LTTSIHPETRIGLLSLNVTDLARSIDFYTSAMGFALLEQHEGSATLGVGTTPLLLLTGNPDGQPWPGRATGLYHFAILLPTRADLGRWLRHWLETGHELPGQGDHWVSEALYLSDPDGNGIEIYRDRPRSEWKLTDGRVAMGTDPVDLRGVVEESDREGLSFTGLPEGTTIGHMHLQVRDIPEARAFYEGVLGFDLMAEMPSALFLSAGGYHHHLGMNIWHSRGASPASEGSAGLRYFTVIMPSQAALDDVIARLVAAGVSYGAAENGIVVQDPSRNRIFFNVGVVPGSLVESAKSVAR
jgi:catechol 2,3-dioxygenase